MARQKASPKNWSSLAGSPWGLPGWRLTWKLNFVVRQRSSFSLGDLCRRGILTWTNAQGGRIQIFKTKSESRKQANPYSTLSEAS